MRFTPRITSIAALILAMSAWLTALQSPSFQPKRATDVVVHTADLILTQLQEVREQLRAGRLRVIAVLGDKRLPSLPNVPTLKEQGINIPSLVQSRGLLAAPGVAPEVTQFWRNLLLRLMRTESWKKYVRDEGLEESYLDGPALVKFWDDQTALMRRALSEGTQLRVKQ